MKSIMKKTIFTLTIGIATLLTACDDDDDVFSQSATERLNSRLSATAELLTTAEYGWALDYYPDDNISYGGIAYTVSFDGLNATVRSEIEEGEATSLYTLKSDDGAILSFDSYNSLMHYFATPSSSEYQGKGGDFEFLIDSIGTDVIKLHGKRNGNTVWMHKLTQPADEYLNSVANIENIFRIASLYDGSQRIASISVDDRRAFLSDDDEDGVPFVFTNKGIRFYRAISIKSEDVSELQYNDNTLTLTNDQLGLSLDAHLGKDLLPTYILTQADAQTKKYVIPHLNVVSFNSVPSWVSLTTNGDTLLVQTTATDQPGVLRKGEVCFQIYDEQDTLMIADLLGSYSLMYYNSDKEESTASAQLTENEDGTLSLSTLGYTLLLTFDEDDFALYFSSHTYAGSVTSSKGNTYQLGLIFMTADYYWTSHYDGYTFGGNISTDTDGTYVEFNIGSLYGYPITALQVGAYSSESLASSTYLGWWDRIWYPVLVKE